MEIHLRAVNTFFYIFLFFYCVYIYCIYSFIYLCIVLLHLYLYARLGQRRFDVMTRVPV